VEYFSQFGEVVSAQLIINRCVVVMTPLPPHPFPPHGPPIPVPPPRSFNQTPRGFGFVAFRDAETIAAVLAHPTPHMIDERPVEVKRALARDDPGAPQRHNPNKHDPCKIFVGGLASAVTEEAFRAHFAAFGAIIDAVVMMDRDTNRSRGFGFVTFEGAGAVQAVLAATEHVIGGRTVDVKAAEPKIYDAYHRTAVLVPTHDSLSPDGLGLLEGWEQRGRGGWGMSSAASTTSSSSSSAGAAGRSSAPFSRLSSASAVHADAGGWSNPYRRRWGGGGGGEGDGGAGGGGQGTYGGGWRGGPTHYQGRRDYGGASHGSYARGTHPAAAQYPGYGAHHHQREGYGGVRGQQSEGAHRHQHQGQEREQQHHGSTYAGHYPAYGPHQEGFYGRQVSPAMYSTADPNVHGSYRGAGSGGPDYPRPSGGDGGAASSDSGVSLPQPSVLPGYVATSSSAAAAVAAAMAAAAAAAAAAYYAGLTPLSLPGGHQQQQQQHMGMVPPPVYPYAVQPPAAQVQEEDGGVAGDGGPLPPSHVPTAPSDGSVEAPPFGSYGGHAYAYAHAHYAPSPSSSSSSSYGSYGGGGTYVGGPPPPARGAAPTPVSATVPPVIAAAGSAPAAYGDPGSSIAGAGARPGDGGDLRDGEGSSPGGPVPQPSTPAANRLARQQHPTS
jgi:hypothetical protein